MAISNNRYNNDQLAIDAKNYLKKQKALEDKKGKTITTAICGTIATVIIGAIGYALAVDNTAKLAIEIATGVSVTLGLGATYTWWHVKGKKALCKEIEDLRNAHKNPANIQDPNFAFDCEVMQQKAKQHNEAGVYPSSNQI